MPDTSRPALMPFMDRLYQRAYERAPNSMWSRMLRRMYERRGRPLPDWMVTSDPAMRGANNAGLQTPQGNQPMTQQPAPTPRGGFGGSNNAAPSPMFSNFGGALANAGMPGMPFGYGSGIPMNTDGIPTYKEGGLVGPGGMPVRPGTEVAPEAQAQQLGASGQPQKLTMDQVEAEANLYVRQHPEEAQKIKQLVEYNMSTGDLTPQELNMFIQLARVALMNPSSWQQVRQFAIQQGVAAEEDIPQEYDPGLLSMIYVISKIVGQQSGGDVLQGQRPAGQAPSGPVPQSADGGVMAQVHEGEYVVPKEALMYHGKKKFDDMVGQARGGQ